MENKGITVVIKSDSIYMHSLATITMKSDNEFSVSTNLEIIDLYKGKNNKTHNLLTSEKGDSGRFYIEFLALGFFQERNAFSDNNCEKVAHYGTRFFPFISSLIKGKFVASQIINSIMFELPDKFRLIFFQANVIQNNSLATLRHSFGDLSSKFVFTWKNSIEKSDNYETIVDVPVRFGGTSFLRLVKFPIYYWLIALLGVALLSITEKPNVVIGAVATTWLFMLQRWNNSNLPQQFTLLTKFYLIFGVTLGVWGVCWETLSYWALLLIAPIGVLTFMTLKAINHFNLKGFLPAYIAKWNAKKVIKLDEKQKNNFA
jgi:hypothetical protein